MAQSNYLKALVRAHASGDENAFREATERLIDEEARKGHRLVARDLRRLLDGPRGFAPPMPGPRRHAVDVPVDEERGLPLAEIRDPTFGLERVVLQRSRSKRSACSLRITDRVSSSRLTGSRRRAVCCSSALRDAARRSRPRGSPVSWDYRCSTSGSTRSSPPTWGRLPRTCASCSTSSIARAGWSCSTSLTRSAAAATIRVSTASSSA